MTVGSCVFVYMHVYVCVREIPFRGIFSKYFSKHSLHPISLSIYMLGSELEKKLKESEAWTCLPIWSLFLMRETDFHIVM